MHQYYEDILSRIAEPPKWFDEHGAPRYCAFAPNKIANIYASECALMEIACQACDTKFLVAIDLATALAHLHPPPTTKATLADLIRSDAIHYGDPPNVRCCSGGDTMNSKPLRILEYWHRNQSSGQHERDKSLGIEIHRDRWLQRQTEKIVNKDKP